MIVWLPRCTDVLHRGGFFGEQTFFSPKFIDMTGDFPYGIQDKLSDSQIFKEGLRT